MSNRLSQKELESYLWGAATLLRGLIDASDYKQYIFPLLFFKRLSDVWDEDYREAFEETSDDGYATATANDRFTIPDGAHWKKVRDASRDVGRALLGAFQAIEAANPQRLQGVFGNAAWTDKGQMPDETLKNLIEHFSRHILSLDNVPEDELGNGYEYLIKQFADDSGHTAQEFYTNRTLVHLMVQMLEPQAGETIYDPTCGTGGMLISCLAEVKRRGGDTRTMGLYGQELINITAAIARSFFAKTVELRLNMRFFRKLRHFQFFGIIAVDPLRQSPPKHRMAEAVLHTGKLHVPVVLAGHDLSGEIIHPCEKVGHPGFARVLRVREGNSMACISLPELIGVQRFKPLIALSLLHVSVFEIVPILPEVVVAGRGGDSLHRLTHLLISLQELHQHRYASLSVLLQKFPRPAQKLPGKYLQFPRIPAFLSCKTPHPLKANCLKVAPQDPLR